MNITSIKINWSESNEIRDGHVFPSLEEANRFLWRVALKEKGKIGYCKVSYTATFEDGEEYQGRIDVSENDGHCFLEAMKSYVSFYAGKSKPHWMKEEQYESLVKDSRNSAETIEWCARLGI